MRMNVDRTGSSFTARPVTFNVSTEFAPTSQLACDDAPCYAVACIEPFHCRVACTVISGIRAERSWTMSGAHVHGYRGRPAESSRNAGRSVALPSPSLRRSALLREKVAVPDRRMVIQPRTIGSGFSAGICAEPLRINARYSRNICVRHRRIIPKASTKNSAAVCWTVSTVSR
jgi:hypothetical protein